MKVIVTGATGFIGSGVLKRCIQHPDVTSIVTLTRRPLDVQDAKLKSIVQKDFLQYDQQIIEQLKGAEACIWVLGSPSSGREVHVDYTMTGVKTLLESVVPQKSEQPFRFVYTSGGAVPLLESMFFLPAILRKTRAQLDRDVLDVEKQNPGRWESFVVRPWQVVDDGPSGIFKLTGAWILRPELGAAMLDAALHGGDRLMDNTMLRAKGQAALKKVPA